MCMSMHHKHAVFLEASGKLPCVFWGLNPGPTEEQPMLFTTLHL